MKAKSIIFAGQIFGIFFLFFNLTSAFYLRLQAQNKINDSATSFELAAAKHKRELQDLIVTRGVSRSYLGDASAESVAKILATRSGKYSDRAGYLVNTAVLFYSYEEDSLHIWLLNEHGIQAYAQKKISQEQITAAINNLRASLRVDSLQAPRLPHERGVRVTIAAENPKLPLNRTIPDLTDILLPAPIAYKLSTVKHLIIVPVLGLGTVPYAILQPFNSESFLIDRMSLSIAPSLFDIEHSIEPWEPRFDNPLIVGNPYLTASSRWVVPPLPGAEKEAKAVATALDTKPLIGREATKETVLSRARGSDLLYFATHGIANSNDPLSGSFLALSAPEFDKGWWTAKEIQRDRLRAAKIAVLSACQTGLGRVHDAGIIGVARAFQIAGVPRVVMSLWSVNDEATNELMQAFVRHLQNNIPSEALQLSMLEVRKKRPDPSLWASFVLFGTPR